MSTDRAGPEPAVTGHDVDQGDPCTTVALPFHAMAVGRARHMMSDELGRAGAPDHVIDDAALVISELVTNGLKHGKPDSENGIEVGWCLYDDRVLLCVCDGGSVGSLRPLELSTTAPTGRGLAIVDYVCDTWTVERSGGTRITAEISIAV